MRHFLKFRSFNSNNSFRKSLFINMGISLIKYEFLKTTIYRAKDFRFFFEPLITIGKNYSNFNFKILFKKIKNIEAIFKIFKIIAPRYIYRKGGYIKINKIWNMGKNSSSMALISFS